MCGCDGRSIQRLKPMVSHTFTLMSCTDKIFTKSHTERLPEWILPSPSALFTPHPIWMDHVPWWVLSYHWRMTTHLTRAKARDVMYRNPSAYANPDFSLPYTQSLSINWPYEPMDTVLEHAPGEYIINPVFERHLRNVDNWTVGPEFANTFPDLRPHIKVRLWYKRLFVMDIACTWLI